MFATTAMAQLNWDLDRCQKEYDQPGTVQTDPADGKQYYAFRVTIEDELLHGSWAIRCWFNDSGACDAIRYEKLDSALSGEDLSLILLLNRCGYTWDTDTPDKLGDDGVFVHTTDPKRGPWAMVAGDRKILLKFRP